VPDTTPRRVVIIGTSGSGKTTLARRLASAIGAPHVELDGLHHGPDWVPAPPERLRAAVRERTGGPCWVVDGTYGSTLADELWPRADTVVWLDLPLPVLQLRIVRRSVWRIVRRTELWNGNRETWGALLGRESLLWWVIGATRRYRVELPARLAELTRRGVTVVRLRSASEVDHWATASTARPAPGR
jgi:adenylate kinase family enzyme